MAISVGPPSPLLLLLPPAKAAASNAELHTLILQLADGCSRHEDAAAVGNSAQKVSHGMWIKRGRDDGHLAHFVARNAASVWATDRCVSKLVSSSIQ